MTDRELLELAAKAAGYLYVTHTGYDEDNCVHVTRSWIRKGNSSDGKLLPWNPRNDDGDALRLAVKLLMEVDVRVTQVVINWAAPIKDDCRERVWVGIEVPTYTVGHEAATRLAILRAAAEIGKGKK